MELLDMYLSYIKLYFQEVKWSVFFFMAQITQVLLVQEWQFGINQRSQFEKDTFSNKNLSMEVLGLCLPYVKRCSQEHQLSEFSFMA